MNGAGLESLLSRWRGVARQGGERFCRRYCQRKTTLPRYCPAVETVTDHVAKWRLFAFDPVAARADSSISRRAGALWGEEKAGSRNAVVAAVSQALELRATPWRDQTTFQRLCSTWHRLNGIGNEWDRTRAGRDAISRGIVG